MSIRIIAMVILFSFPGGLFIVGLIMAIHYKLNGGSIMKLIQSIKSMGSLVFAEEFSLAEFGLEERERVVFNFDSCRDGYANPGLS